jgi:hypothetical protein
MEEISGGLGEIRDVRMLRRPISGTLGGDFTGRMSHWV